mgnify:CR=1 FL=1
MISYNAIRKNKTLLQVLNTSDEAMAESKSTAAAESDKKE